MQRVFTLALTIFILLAAFYLNIHNLPDYPTGTSNDESVNVVDAGQVLQARQFQMLFYSEGGRPEMLYRLMLAGFVGFVGQSIFSFRLMSAFIGVMTAAAGGAAVRVFFARSPMRDTAMLAAMTSLAINQSFMTLSRSLYRAVPTPLFCLLFLLFLWRGTQHVLDNPHASRKNLLLFAGAGIFMGLTINSYTSGWFAAPLVGVAGLHLLIMRWRQWRAWLPGVVLMGVILVLMVTPIFYLLATNRERVLSRADSVSNPENQQDLKELFLLEDFTYISTHREITWNRYLNKGDLNPQYNTGRAPLMPRGSAPLFYLGIVVCLLLVFFRYEAAQVLALLLLSIVPITLSNEYFHGLRIILGFAVVPLLCGTAVGETAVFIYRFFPRQQTILIIQGLVTLGLLLYIPPEIQRIQAGYQAYFVEKNPRDEPLQGDEISMGEWYFRPQYRDSAAYILSSDQPVYLSWLDLNNPALRSQLQQHYPHVRTDYPQNEKGLPELTDGRIYAVADLGDPAAIVDDFHIMVVVPPDGDTLYILPPLTDASAKNIADQLLKGDSVFGENNRVVGRTFAAEAIDITFAPIQPANGVIFGDSIQVIGYTHPPALIPGTSQTYCLIWQAIRDISRNKTARVELWGYDFVGFNGEDQVLLRWLYPSVVWRQGDHIPTCYHLTLPERSLPGLYWLAAGIHEPHLSSWQPTDTTGHPLGENLVQVAPLKIPQTESLPEPTHPLQAQLMLNDNEFIQLQGFDLNPAQLKPGDTIDLYLYWESTTPPRQPYTIFIHVEDGNQKLVAQQDTQGGRYPTIIWGAGETIRTQHQLTIPAEAKVPLRLYVGMYSLSDLQRLPVLQNGQMDDNNRIILYPEE